MMEKRLLLILLGAGFLVIGAGCNGPAVAVETAVPTITSQSTPTIQSTAPPTASIAAPAMTANETAVPDFDPLTTPDHSAIAPTRDPGANLDDLITLIREKLDGRCISFLHSVMSDEFLLSFYPAGVFTGDKK